jgi:hypothetical protein
MDARTDASRGPSRQRCRGPTSEEGRPEGASRDRQVSTIRRLLGLDSYLWQRFEQDHRAIIAGADLALSVGKFGDSWDRTIMPTGLAPRLHQFWTKGGVRFAPPMRCARPG